MWGYNDYDSYEDIETYSETRKREDNCNFLMKHSNGTLAEMNRTANSLRTPTEFYHCLTSLMNCDMNKLTIDDFIELYIFDKSNLKAYCNRETVDITKNLYSLGDAKEYLKCLFIEKDCFMKNVIVGACNRTTMFNSLMASSRSDGQKKVFKSFYKKRNHTEIARNYAYNQIYKMPKKTIQRVANELNKTSNRFFVVKDESVNESVNESVSESENESVNESVRVIKDYPKYKIFNDGRVFSDYTSKFLQHSKDESGYYVNLWENKKKCKIFIKDLLKEYFNENVDVIKVENAPDLLVTTVPSKPNEYQKKRYTFTVMPTETTYMIKD